MPTRVIYPLFLMLACLLSAPLSGPLFGQETAKDLSEEAKPPVIHGDIPEKIHISERKVKKILRRHGFSRVKILEIDYEIFENQKVYEVDFKYKGKIYEAAISLNHKFLYSEIDIDD
ncbi:hypothetical protein [Thalassomonas actiniarum]|uniref:PepSY domain-containing protein n=1 Tax=Thalassomonas actiniarum TaxID=485447 RepID=A0AAE9YRF3_9GAMM|nr:hypothetical protein [Thalassomonas actiniarum]WDD99830.1 hypothetical protein SG35_003925 [Thalassomonas actiniarum]